MKKNIISSLLIIGLSVAFISISCKKKGSDCNAGTGGNLTVVAFLKHHGMVITNKAWHPDTVYVKFNAQNSPGTNPSSYDKFFVGEAGEDHIHLEGLQCGDYYFYGTGLDTTLDTIQNPHVSGGIPFSTENTSGEIDLNIPVSE
jgi:hypothetical protein